MNTDNNVKRQKNNHRYLIEKQKMAENPEYADMIRRKRRNAKRNQRLKAKQLAKNKNSQEFTL